MTMKTWSQASSNEYGRLMNGNDAGINGTNTMEPIALENIPPSHAITYGLMVCDHRPLKKSKIGADWSSEDIDLPMTMRQQSL